MSLFFGAEFSDPVGNRRSSLGVPLYNYNSSNELTSNSSASYTYDLNGNELTKADSTGTTSYTWDFENRLTSVTLPGSGGMVSFSYDPFGRRIKKVSSTGTSIFAYDGDNLVEETSASGAAVARYSQGLNIDEPLAMLLSSTTSYYQADGLGSVTSLSSAAGAIAQTYAFDSFGNQTASSGSLTNQFQYTGREFDTETNLYYYRVRYYDPSIGRFLGEDPIGFKGSANFYGYVDNNPILYNDPDGQFKVCCRPALIHKALFFQVACHCFLVLSDGTTLGGYKNGAYLDAEVNKKPDDDYNDPAVRQASRCTDISGSQCEENKLKDAHKKIPRGLPYGFLGMTSNTVAAWTLYQSGADLSGTFDRYRFPKCAIGAGMSILPIPLDALKVGLGLKPRDNPQL